jgi:hypothetical protein
MRELIDRYDPDLEQAVGLHHVANERLGASSRKGTVLIRSGTRPERS